MVVEKKRCYRTHAQTGANREANHILLAAMTDELAVILGRRQHLGRPLIDWDVHLPKFGHNKHGILDGVDLRHLDSTAGEVMNFLHAQAWD